MKKKELILWFLKQIITWTLSYVNLNNMDKNVLIFLLLMKDMLQWATHVTDKRL